MVKYFKHKLNNLIRINEIITIHFYEFAKDYKWHGELHDFWEFVFCDKNSIICKSENREITVNSGEILFHKPNEFHSLRGNGKSSSKIYVVSFSCKSSAMNFFENKKIYLDSALSRYIYKIIEEGISAFDMDISNTEIIKMELQANAPLGCEQIIKNYLEILLIEIIRRNAHSYANAVFFPENEFKNELTNKVIKILKDNVFKNIDINYVCQSISFSKSHICREFKKITGMTIIDYFNKLKIDKAKELLKSDSLTIREISERLSYDTPNYFCKAFKTRIGLTPSQYRNSLT